MKTKTCLVKVCYGVSSKVNDYDHVVMFDYDYVDLDTVVDHIIHLQHEYNFSDFYIIESTHGFNTICLDMLTPSLIYQIGIDVCSPADRDFFKYGFRRGYYVLRFDLDKQLVGIIYNDSSKYKKSNAHKKFLEWFFDIEIKGSNFDDNNKIDIIQYPSNKNGFHYVSKDLGGIDYNKRQLSR